MAVLRLQSIAARVRFLSAQVDELDPELMTLLKQHPAGPALLAEPGVGPIVAAQLLVSWSHRGRVRSEAAFAALSGTAPLEASSGQRTRHRLNRGGDRDLNRALHTVAITRMRCHPETRAYHAKPTAQARPIATSDAVSSEPSLAGSTDESKPPHTNSRSQPRLDKQRSIHRPAPPIPPQERRSAPARPGRHDRRITSPWRACAPSRLHRSWDVTQRRTDRTMAPAADADITPFGMSCAGGEPPLALQLSWDVPGPSVRQARRAGFTR
jgi:hypothetical protein